MDKFDRIFQLHSILRDRPALPSNSPRPRLCNASNCASDITVAAATSTPSAPSPPQRVTHYRDSWYLDVWDETKGAHR
jgi:hypothetical protein